MFYDAYFEPEFNEEDFLDMEEDEIDFMDPGGVSALRAATNDNPRNLPCPNCHEPNRLTPEDRHRGYQCDDCANRTEMGLDY